MFSSHFFVYSVSNSSFDGSRSFSAHLFIQASAADNGSSITAMLTFSSSQRSGVLLVSPNNCPRFFSSNLTVEYNFTILGAVGTFSCLEGGYPFFRNLSSPLSLRTDCTDQFTWRGYSDLECRYREFWLKILLSRVEQWRHSMYCYSAWRQTEILLQHYQRACINLRIQMSCFIMLNNFLYWWRSSRHESGKVLNNLILVMSQTN